MLDLINFSDTNPPSLDFFQFPCVTMEDMPLLQSFVCLNFRAWLLGAAKNVETVAHSLLPCRFEAMEKKVISALGWINNKEKC